jgi:hypothetical protein
MERSAIMPEPHSPPAGPLDRAAVRAWLADQPPERKFTAKDSRCCPIAKFLNEHGHPAAIVHETVWRSRAGTEPNKSPGWCGAFVSAIDASGVDHPTAARALEILDSIPEETP